MAPKSLHALADWEDAPDLMGCTEYAEMSAESCGLEYWFTSVAQGTLKGLENGHRPGLVVPDHMIVAGPLRDSMLKEMAFRSRTETVATKGLCQLVRIAPASAYADFYITQAMDEARHSHIFRTHILDLGIGRDELDAVIENYVGKYIQSILTPIEKWALSIVEDDAYFYGGVATITILLEGVLAPAAALSEKKWHQLDSIAADIERGANIDEVRHLNVGASIIKEYLYKQPEEKDRLLDVIMSGREKWESLPVQEMVFEREILFQHGIEPLSHLLKNYEIIPGVLLIDTTPESRMHLSFQWSKEMQDSRLRYMGLEEAIRS